MVLCLWKKKSRCCSLSESHAVGLGLPRGRAMGLEHAPTPSALAQARFVPCEGTSG